MFRTALLWLWEFLLARLGYARQQPPPTTVEVAEPILVGSTTVYPVLAGVEQLPDGSCHFVVGTLKGTMMPDMVVLVPWQGQTIKRLLEQTRRDA